MQTFNKDFCFFWGDLNTPEKPSFATGGTGSILTDHFSFLVLVASLHNILKDSSNNNKKKLDMTETMTQLLYSKQPDADFTIIGGQIMIFHQPRPDETNKLQITESHHLGTLETHRRMLIAAELCFFLASWQMFPKYTLFAVFVPYSPKQSCKW